MKIWSMMLAAMMAASVALSGCGPKALTPREKPPGLRPRPQRITAAGDHRRRKRPLPGPPQQKQPAAGTAASRPRQSSPVIPATAARRVSA